MLHPLPKFSCKWIPTSSPVLTFSAYLQLKKTKQKSLKLQIKFLKFPMWQHPRQKKKNHVTRFKFSNP